MFSILFYNMRPNNIIKTSLTTVILGLTFAGCNSKAIKQNEEKGFIKLEEGLIKHNENEKKSEIHSYEEEIKYILNLKKIEIWKENCEDYMGLHRLIKERRNPLEIISKIRYINGKYCIDIVNKHKKVCSETFDKGRTEMHNQIIEGIGLNSIVNSVFSEGLAGMILKGEYGKAENMIETGLSRSRDMNREFVNSILMNYPETMPDSIPEKIKETFKEESDKIGKFLAVEGYTF
jgi:hypothetical protein